MVRIVVAGLIFASIAWTETPAQTPAAFGTCVPVARRMTPNEVGCFIITEQKLGEIGSEPAYWHVTRFGSRAEAEAASDSRSTVMDAFGKSWLLTIAGPKWRAARGSHVAAIGPLPIHRSVRYAALYMEASMRPGMKSMIHRHSGPEAWYTLSGETCLETPNGTQVGKPGKQVIVPGDLPMELTATGSALRRSLVLILYDSSRKPTTMETTWKPSGKCKAPRQAVKSAR